MTHWASEVQVVGQVALLPLQTKGAHVGTPAAPEASVVQAPSAVAPVAALQTSQDPAHVELQQTLFLQESDRHWSFAAHAPAVDRRATQVPFWQ